MPQEGRGGKKIFVRRGWDFGIARVLAVMHQDKNSDFCKAAAQMGDLPFDDTETFWGSPYGKLLDELCRNKLSTREGWELAGLYMIGACESARACLLLIVSWPDAHESNLVASSAGGDAGQIFNNRAWSSTVMGIRRFDLHPAFNAKDMSWGPFLVLEGDTEPQTFEFILEPTFVFFARHDPGAAPVLHVLVHARADVSAIAWQIYMYWS